MQKTMTSTGPARSAADFSVSVGEISALLDRLSRHGETQGQGITRLLYHPAWINVQQEVAQCMTQAGLRARVDYAGNVIGRAEGTVHQTHPVATGSHVDTVKCGGRYDGQLGIIGGILAAKHLLQRFGPPKRSLEVVSFAEEEGSRFSYTFWGSRNYIGKASIDQVAALCDDEGISFSEAMRRAGFPPDAPAGPVDLPKAFLELHVEQGDTLERTESRIGVVSEIAAQRRFTVKLSGQANHAGTSSMAYRRDALMGFSHISVRCTEKARKWDDALTLTFGKLHVAPNTPNVIPGEVAFSVDCRHGSDEVLARFCTAMQEDMAGVAATLGLDIQFTEETEVNCVAMDESMVDMLKEICAQRGVAHRVMSSGAGHDTQVVASVSKSAMLFVPSVGGISHNPQEYTRPEDLALGIEILTEALYRMAYLGEV